MDQSTAVWYMEYVISSLTYLYLRVLLEPLLQSPLRLLGYFVVLPVYITVVLLVIGNLEDSEQEVDKQTTDVA